MMDDQGPNLWVMGAISLFFSCAVLLAVLSSSQEQNVLPALALPLFGIAPIPRWWAGSSNGDDIIEEETSLLGVGRVVTGFLITSGVALPVMLAHTGNMGIATMIQSIVGGFIVFVSVVLFRNFLRNPPQSFSVDELRGLLGLH